MTAAKRGVNTLRPKIIGILSGILAVGVYTCEFKGMPLCRS